MATETNYGATILNHVESIDNVKFEELLDKVSKFIRTYEKVTKVSSEQQRTQEERIRSEEERRLREQRLNEQRLKNEQAKTEEEKKLLEQQLDLQRLNSRTNEKLFNTINNNEKLRRISESDSLKYSQDQSRIFSRINDTLVDTYSHSRKVEKINEKLEQRRNVFANINSKLEERHFELQSEYYKSIEDKVNYMKQTWKEFKDNPEGFILEKMGLVLGKAVDKSIDGVKYVIKSGLEAISKGMSDLSNSIFEMIGEQKRQAESIAKELNRGYTETAGVLSRSNIAVAQLSMSNDLNLSRTMPYIESVTEKMFRDYGDKIKEMSQDEYNKIFKLYAQAENYKIGGKIDDYRQAFGSDDKAFTKALETAIQLEGIMTRVDERTKAAMKQAEINIEDAHSLGMTKEQAIVENQKNQMAAARYAATYKELSIDDIGALFKLQKELNYGNFITNILSDKNVNLAQLIGMDADEVKRKLNGSENEKFEVFNKIISSGRWSEIPALRDLMEGLGFSNQGLSVLQRVGMVTDKDALQRLDNASKQDFVNLNEQMFSDKSQIESALNSRINLLSSEGIRDVNGNITDLGKLLTDQLTEINTIDQYQRKYNKDNDKELTKRGLELYDLIRRSEEGDVKATEALNTLSERDKHIVEDLKSMSENAKQLTKDQIQVSTTLSEAHDLGFDKALSGGGLSSIFSGLLETGLKSAYSPEYQKKLNSFMGNLKEAIKPAVNVFKQLLIDPILVAIKDNIGGLLGNILSILQEKFGIGGDDRLGDSDSEESLFNTENKFKERTIVDEQGNERSVGLVDYEALNVLQADKNNSYSDNFKKAAQEIRSNTSASFKDVNDVVNKYKLNNEEAFKLKSFVVSRKRGTLGDVIKGNSELEEQTKSEFDESVKSSSMQDVLTSSKTLAQADQIANKETRKVYGYNLLGQEKEISSYETLGSEYNKNIFSSEEEWEKFKDIRNRILRMFLTEDGLLKDNKDLIYKEFEKQYGINLKDVNGSSELALALLKTGGSLDISIDKEGDNKAYINIYKDNKGYLAKAVLKEGEYTIGPLTVGNNNWGEPQYYYEQGGLVKAQQGGVHAVLGEAGHDEIVIPTDPDKHKQAQKLLELAKDKYNVFLKDPQNTSEKTEKWFRALVFSTKMLMLQLDPLKDIVANSLAQQTFNILRLYGIYRLRNKTTSNQGQEQAGEELIGYMSPSVGAPIKNANSLDEVRNRIIQHAISLTGTPYKCAPQGLVCNELVNAAYGTVLGKKPYEELLHNLGYNYNNMWTISAFLNILGKNGYPGLLARNVSYADIAALAKPADLVFSAPNDTIQPTQYNPFHLGHVSMYIDPTSKIDSTSVKTNGKDGVGIHKPNNAKNLMAYNILDLMPYSWYLEKGILKAQDKNIIGMDKDGNPIYADYDPSKQKVPNASSVANNVSRMNSADIEKEKQRAEKQSRSTEKILKQMEKTLKLFGVNVEERKSIMSVNTVSPEYGFCTGNGRNVNIYHGR